MDPERDRLDEGAPEVFHSTYPEAVQHPLHNNVQPKLEDGSGIHTSSATPYPNYGSLHDHSSSQGYHASAGGEQLGREKSSIQEPHLISKNKGLLCGCSTLVFVLSAIIAVLAAAVVGLAVGTGVEAHRANIAEAKVSAMSSRISPTTVTTSAATTTVASTEASSTSYAALDSDCSGDPSGVSGKTYNSFSLIANQSFTIRCNADAVGSPLLSLFTSTLDTCMDACAAYTTHSTENFGNITDSICGGVSFIPEWTNKTVALSGTAPGNCYLKPTQTAAPTAPTIGTECHAGIVNNAKW